ncbi:MAG: rifampicin phosphotransferase, partial [Acidimicrobiaceae bacterium]
MIDRWIVDSKPSSRYPIFTRGNVGEVFPDPVAPLSGDLITLYSEPGWRDSLARFGAMDHEEFDPNNNEIIGIFGGYCYLNVSASRILGVRTPGLTPEMIDFQIFGAQPGVSPYTALETDESPAHSERILETLTWVLTTESLPELLADEQMLDDLRDARPDFTQMSERELVDRVKSLFDTHFR